MNSDELSVPGTSLKCFFFEFKFRRWQKKQPFAFQKFFVLPPSNYLNKEDAFFYLAHALLVTRCYDAKQLLKLHLREFNSSLSLVQFSERHAQVFDAWESMRRDRSVPVLFTDEESLKKIASSLDSSVANFSPPSTEADAFREKNREGKQTCTCCASEEIVSSSSNQSEFPSSYTTCSATNDLPSGKGFSAVEMRLRKELEIRDNAVQRQKDVILSLKNRLNCPNQRGENSEKSSSLYSIIKENECAVASIENNYKAREEELQKLFQSAMQERDIRIAQLSASQAKLLHQQNDYILRIKELENLLANSRKQVHSSTTKSTSSTSSHTENEFFVSHLRDVQRCYTLLSEEYKKKEKREIELIEALSTSKNRILIQEEELRRAYFVITTLQDGLRVVKQFLPQC